MTCRQFAIIFCTVSMLIGSREQPCTHILSTGTHKPTQKACVFVNHRHHYATPMYRNPSLSGAGVEPVLLTIYISDRISPAFCRALSRFTTSTSPFCHQTATVELSGGQFQKLFFRSITCTYTSIWMQGIEKHPARPTGLGVWCHQWLCMDHLHLLIKERTVQKDGQCS